MIFRQFNLAGQDNQAFKIPNILMLLGGKKVVHHIFALLGCRRVRSLREVLEKEFNLLFR